MDEPDSFLSIAGQRNLLQVFESLVSKNLLAVSCQLVYTTHSPFLINRNFPHRLCLVRKGDGNEGTQLFHDPIFAVMNRYDQHLALIVLKHYSWDRQTLLLKVCLTSEFSLLPSKSLEIRVMLMPF